LKGTINVPLPSIEGTKIASVESGTIVVPYDMDWLKKRLKEIGKTGAGLARALGTSKQRIYEMYRGDRRFQQDEIARAARFLEWTEAELLARIEGRRAYSVSKVSEKVPPPASDKTLTPLVLYRAVPSHTARQAGYMLQAEQIGEIARPGDLEFSPKAFAVKLLDASCEPAYRFLDTLLVDPEDPLVEGEDCIFTADKEEPSGGHCVIARLKRSTDTAWITRGFTSEEELPLPRSEFPYCWPIIGKFRRR
jgi:SOS-response transcriptional repressor LexA